MQCSGVTSANRTYERVNQETRVTLADKDLPLVFLLTSEKFTRLERNALFSHRRRGGNLSDTNKFTKRHTEAENELIFVDPRENMQPRMK